jgi:uncharacterized membrane protein
MTEVNGGRSKKFEPRKNSEVNHPFNHQLDINDIMIWYGVVWYVVDVTKFLVKWKEWPESGKQMALSFYCAMLVITCLCIHHIVMMMMMMMVSLIANSWEPEENMASPDLIADFRRQKVLPNGCTYCFSLYHIPTPWMDGWMDGYGDIAFREPKKMVTLTSVKNRQRSNCHQSAITSIPTLRRPNDYAHYVRIMKLTQHQR